MEYTKNYHLPQWAESDRIMMTDFNQAMENIEDGLGQVLTTTEEGQQALAESVRASLEEITADLGNGGHNMRVAAGSWIGTGLYGSANPMVLETGFQPIKVSIMQEYGAETILMRPITHQLDGNSNQAVVTWRDTSVSWYCDSSVYTHQNASGTQYFYIVFGYSV